MQSVYTKGKGHNLILQMQIQKTTSHVILNEEEDFDLIHFGRIRKFYFIF